MAILPATALLSQTIPPRSLGLHADHDHMAAAPGYSTVASARGRMAFISVDPAVAGRNRLDIRLSDDNGRPFSPLELSVQLQNDIAGFEPISQRLEKIGDGHYRLVGPDLAVSGSWRLKIDALISDYEQISFAATLHIPRNDL